MVEPGRKHGPFDFRYPVGREIATPVRELQRDRDGSGRLEWPVFVARFFPHRRRHDLAALAAYAAYGDRAASTEHSPKRRAARAGASRGRVGASPRATRVTAATTARVRTTSPAASVVDWESEGGSVPRDSD